jgi:hypothetical protein
MTDDKELQEQAYEIAEYIHKNPIKRTPLRDRVRGLSLTHGAQLDALVEEVATWLLQFEMQGKE